MPSAFAAACTRPPARCRPGNAHGTAHLPARCSYTEVGARYEYAADYPRPYQNGVWRLTFMVRFCDRLYAGLQDYNQNAPNDYVYFAPARERARVEQDDLHAARITHSGTAQTLRWYADSGTLYWIAWNPRRRGPTREQ